MSKDLPTYRLKDFLLMSKEQFVHQRIKSNCLIMDFHSPRLYFHSQDADSHSPSSPFQKFFLLLSLSDTTGQSTPNKLSIST